MFEKFKEFIKQHKILCVVIVVVFVVCVAFVSCSSIGDGNSVQFGLVNDSIGDHSAVAEGDGLIYGIR